MRRLLQFFGRVLRVGLVAAGILLAVAVVALGGLFLVGRSHWGQQKLLAAILPLVDRSLTGELRVAQVSTDLTHMLVVRGVELTDAEGRVALRAERIGLRYNLLALLVHKVDITAVHVQGAAVYARRLADGSLNLARLVVPSNKPPSSAPLPVTVQVSGIELDAELHDDALPPPINAAAAQAHVEGEVVLARGSPLSLQARLTALKLVVREPLRAELRATAQLSLGGAGLLLRDVQAQLQTEGEQVDRLIPDAKLRGPLSLRAQASGSLAELSADLTVDLPQGRVRLRGTAGPAKPGPPWQGTLALDGVGLQALRADLPPVVVQLALSASGEGPRGRVQVDTLSAAGLGAQLRASGFFAGDFQPLNLKQSEAELKLTASVSDLRKLRELGLPAATGEAKLAGHLQLRDHKTSIDLDASGKGLAVAGMQAQKLDLQLHTADLDTRRGQLTLAGDGLVLSGYRLDELRAQAQGGKSAVSLQLSGRVAPAIEFGLDVDAQPSWQGQELTGVVANLKSLRLHKAAEELQLTQPAQVSVALQGPAAPILVASDFHVALAEQQLVASGRFEGGTSRLAARLDAKKLDARRWTALLGLDAPVPSTQLDAHVELAGPLRTPHGRVEVTGTTQPLPALQLPATSVALRANLAARRVAGEASVAIGEASANDRLNDRPQVGAHFDLPLLLTGPLTLDLSASAGAEQLAAFLPPALPVVHELKAPLSLAVHLKGSVERPEAELELAAKSWQLGPLHGTQTSVAASYSAAAQQLALRVGAKLHNDSGAALGGLAASLKAPLRAQLTTPVPVLLAQLRAAPLLAEVKVSDVQLPQTLQLALLPSESPLRSGVLNGGLELKGSVAAPELSLAARLDNLAVGPLHELAVNLAGSYQGSNVDLAVDAALEQKPMLLAKLSTRVELAKLLAAPAKVMQTLPLEASAQLLPFDLQRLWPVLKGQLTAQVVAKGTPTSPEVTAQLRGTALQVSTWRVGTVAADASFDLARQLQATLEVQQADPASGLTTAGTLNLRFTAPLLALRGGAEATPTLTLRAKRFRVDYSPGDTVAGDGAHSDETELLMGSLRRARATLDADAEIVLGHVPTLRGFVKVGDGALFHKALPQELRDITLDLEMQPDGHLRLVELAAKADNGSMRMEGSAQVSGGKLAEAQLQLAAKQFPIAAGSIGAWLDTHVKVQARSTGDTLHVDVELPDGTLRLPKLAQSHDLQSLDPLADVKFIDHTAQEQAARLRAEQAAKARARAERASQPVKEVPLLPPKLLVKVHLPGQFSVAGPEVKTDLQGHLQLRLEPPALDGPVITGELTSQGGWVEILGRRYQLARAAVSLSGETPPNPLLDVVISRNVDSATISIVVSGTAARPKISFRSEPPIYDESQIIAIILSGQAGGNISSQALGALSSLLVGSIKEQLGALLPIDVIKFDVAGNDPMGLGSSSLEIGKYLRDDLYFSYMHRFGSATTGLRLLNIEEVRLEYRFLSRFQLRIKYGDAQVGALDLDWTKRF